MTNEQSMDKQYNDNQKKKEDNQNLKDNWKQLKAHVKQQWVALTDDDLTYIASDQNEMIDRIQKRYQQSREAVENEVNHWRRENQY